MDGAAREQGRGEFGGQPALARLGACVRFALNFQNI